MIFETVWEKPVELNELEGNDVHIWLVNIEEEFNNLEYYSGLLSDDELNRARRFVFEKDRNRHIIAHGILRSVIGRYMGISPGAVCFSSKKHGKPFLIMPERNKLMFNISHSGKYIIYAFTKNNEVGIDIERIKEMNDSDKIVGRFFSTNEIKEYFELPSEIRGRAFFTCWTRKEAFIKAIGDGLYCPLNSFSVSPDPEVNSKIELHDDKLAGNFWELFDIYITDENYVSAAVIENGYDKLFYWKWADSFGNCT